MGDEMPLHHVPWRRPASLHAARAADVEVPAGSTGRSYGMVCASATATSAGRAVGSGRAESTTSGVSAIGQAGKWRSDLDPGRRVARSHYTGRAAEMPGGPAAGGGTRMCGPGVTRSSREKRTPSALRRSAQPEAVFDRVHGTVRRVRGRARRRPRVVVPGGRGPVRPHPRLHAVAHILGRRPAERLAASGTAPAIRPTTRSEASD